MYKNILQLKAILEAIDKIEQYTADFKNAQDLYHDIKSFDATMMQFIVIGESINRLDDEFKNKYSSIPWQKIKDFRNIIAHDYFGIDADEIWDIVNSKILPLKHEVEKLIKFYEDDF